METPYPNPISPSQTRVGWIGIGVMGAAMAGRLLSAGYSLTIYARTPSKAFPLTSRGAHFVDSPRGVAERSDVVFTMVGHPSDVRSVVLDEGGVLSGLKPGGVVVDTTSSHPGLAREIFAAARERVCWAVDSPVSGGDIGARDGKLAILAGGDGGVVEWLSPLFELMGKVTYMGGPGCGQSSKIANQIVVGANLLGLSEGLVFAEWAGLNVRQFMNAIRGGAAGSKVMELFGERMIEKDFKPGGFAEYMVKDLGMGVDVVEGGEDEKVAVLPGAALGKQLFSAMVANGKGTLGTQGLISVIDRSMAGTRSPLGTFCLEEEC
ncbi:probable 3-hydroxyisobutyrate dehydrogenase-like 2, mitochondrial isoform X2 [Punica granatum]|uniref:Probable 3-hydroxyisobutyrate dehydrogenase-like 2, mitochondrial isoform X2 n=1 Tax=Punica granatum TaxID=22663 RepID=A0A6P8CP48_PUNGR|nr:probable 3-hydroxyisobutyrate dehydrogenase-like 2, mitochondrial isoform X2 [Punica granatum]